MAEYKSITDWRQADQIAESTIVSSDGREVRVERRQRCDDILEAAHAARDLPKLKHMRHSATVPLVLYHKWMVEAGIRPGDPATSRQMVEVIKRKVQTNEYNRLLIHGF